jgi:hypothetical protein
VHYQIAGRTVRMPVVVRDAVAATAVFAVPDAPARALLPPGLSLVPARPGQALLLLTAVRYRRNDLGTYDELSIALAARHGLKVGPYIHRLPVDDEFSCAAGHGIWGFPKTVEDLDVEEDGGDVVCRWDTAGGRVLRLRVPSGGSGRLPATSYRAFSVIGKRLQRTRFVMRADGFARHRGDVDLELGDGEVADELRRLCLPKRPLFSATMARLEAKFDAPQPV